MNKKRNSDFSPIAHDTSWGKVSSVFISLYRLGKCNDNVLIEYSDEITSILRRWKTRVE